jgi:hypothetical protein
LSHFEEAASYEISKKTFEGFGQISSFLLLKSPYLVNRFYSFANMLKYCHNFYFFICLVTRPD